jgi:hypothetical protein
MRRIGLAVALALVLSAPLIIETQHAASHVGPSYLYPDSTTTPGVVNPNISQANIQATICNPTWSTKSIRPPVSYTNALKKQQLAASKFKDQTPSHYEEDHLISLSSAATLAIRRTCGPKCGRRRRCSGPHIWGQSPGIPSTNSF